MSGSKLSDMTSVTHFVDFRCGMLICLKKFEHFKVLLLSSIKLAVNLAERQIYNDHFTPDILVYSIK